VLWRGFGGGVFYFDSQEAVWLAEPQPLHTPRKIAESFAVLLDGVFIGPTYLDLFAFGAYDGSQWFQFMKKHSWA